MDKPKKNGSTITIKLNGEPHTFEEEVKEKEKVEIRQQEPDVIDAESDHEETDVFLETAAAQESMDESFDWIIPETAVHDIDEYKIVNHQKNKKSTLPKIASFTTNTKKKDGNGFRSIAVSAVFAIILGTGFGFLMLKLVLNEHSNKPTTEQVLTEGQGSEKTDTPAATGASAAVKPLNTFVIQGGVYSSKDGAEATANQLAKKGVPSQSIDIGGSQYLFLGVASTIDDAKKLSSNLKDQGIADVWAKPLSITQKDIKGVNAADKTFLETAGAIYQNLSEVTAAAMLTESIPEESFKSVSELIGKTDSKELKNSNVKSLQNFLSSAVGKVEAFQKTKDQNNLVEAQQNLLNFLSIYNSL
ncbi:SPOR domain-containing protein [Neobacillus niacini]|uniref:SPOR domain-containing protein n=1 Tax=Neobacillus niacini TaxID=86668 RepID=UPI002861733F|nr:SPOR domain-containing protein [Neobacillus niacini]MDR7001483.1 stage II sporulation protein B [Neobacillus niacini]